jgi:hypothetical protein
MTPAEETEVLKFVRDMREAMLGDLTGAKPGALHILRKLGDDFYRPDNPKRSMDERLMRLEDEKQRRAGFIAACSIIGGFIGFVLNLIINWIAGKK